VALRGNISAPVWITDLVEVPKDVSSLLVCTKKNFLLGGADLLSDVISGRLFGQLLLALGANR